jgi:hypothetical protein
MILKFLECYVFVFSNVLVLYSYNLFMLIANGQSDN